jgi:hypothetical protein
MLRTTDVSHKRGQDEHQVEKDKNTFGLLSFPKILELEITSLVSLPDTHSLHFII